MDLEDDSHYSDDDGNEWETLDDDDEIQLRRNLRSKTSRRPRSSRPSDDRKVDHRQPIRETKSDVSKTVDGRSEMDLAATTATDSFCWSRPSGDSHAARRPAERRVQSDVEHSDVDIDALDLYSDQVLPSASASASPRDASERQKDSSAKFGDASAQRFFSPTACSSVDVGTICRSVGITEKWVGTKR